MKNVLGKTVKRKTLSLALSLAVAFAVTAAMSTTAFALVFWAVLDVQNGAIAAGTAGQSATFRLSINDPSGASIGAITWYTNATDNVPCPAPQGITPVLPPRLWSSSDSVMMNGDDSTVAGDYYFSVTVEGVESNVQTLTVVVGVTASASALTTATGTTTVTLGSVIPGLAAEDIAVKNGSTTLTDTTDYTLSGLDSTSVGITFTEAAALHFNNPVTVTITKAGYSVNGGSPISVANNLPAIVASYDDFDEAVGNSSYDTIYINGAITLTGDVGTITRSVTITSCNGSGDSVDVGDYPLDIGAGGAVTLSGNLTVTSSATAALKVVNVSDSSGALTVTGSARLTSSSAEYSASTICVDSGTLTISGSASVESAASGYGIYSNGSVSISGGTITATPWGIGIHVNAGTATVTGGTITAGMMGRGVLVAGGTADISGATINASGDSSDGVRVSGGTANINDSATINASGDSSDGVRVVSGTANINDSAVINATGNSSDGVEVIGGTANISGGIISATKIGGATPSDAVNVSGGTVNISEGTLNAPSNCGVYIYSGNAVITGGTITATEGWGVHLLGGAASITGGIITGTDTWSVYLDGGAANIGGTASITSDIVVNTGSTLNLTCSSPLSITGNISGGAGYFLTSLPAPLTLTAPAVNLPIGINAEAGYSVVTSDTSGELNTPVINADGSITMNPTDAGAIGGPFNLVLTATPSDSGTLKLTIPVTVREFAGGSGMSDDPWLITTAAQLDNVRYHLGGYFQLGQDITLSGSWMPIGDNTTPFTGCFDGNDGAASHTISGLTVNSAQNYAGLFGYIDDATVQNLKLTGVSVTGNNYVGALAGYVGSGSISGCSVSGSVTATDDSTADFIKVGGLAGENHGTIAACSAAVTVTAANSIDVSAYTGGLVGQNGGTIQISYATGNVTGNVAGGLVGYNAGSAVENCYATGSVTGSSSNVGGLLGFSNSGTIEYCYAIGQVTAGSGGGGLIGSANDGATIAACCYNSQTTGQSDTGKGTPLTTAQMVQTANFSGWGFGTVWSISGSPNPPSYPYLPSNYVPGNLPAPTAPTGLTINAEPGSLPLTYGGASVTLTTTASGPTGCLGTVAWSSSDETIATVTSDGAVTPHRAGTANITAHDVFNGIVSAMIQVTVNKKELTITGDFTADDKTYNGSASATIHTNNLSLAGVVSGDEDYVSLNAVAAFADENASAAARTVSLTGSTLAAGSLGSKTGDYLLNTGAPTAAAYINAKQLTVASITASDKPYDGTTAATITNSSLTGIVRIGGVYDDVALNNATATATFDGKDVESHTVALTAGILTGTKSGNYTLSLAGTLTTTANITPKQLTVSGITAADKIYDGTNTAAITGVTLSGIVAGEESGVSVSSPMGTFSDAGVADAKTVTLTGGTLAGIAKDNYTLSLTGTLTATANITPKQLTVSGITAADKIYDGNTSAIITSSTLSGSVGSDDVSLNAVATFADKDAADGKTVSLTSDSSLIGGKKDNYTLSLDGAATDTANITVKQLAIGGISVADKPYDGTNTAAITGVTLAGKVDSDDVSVASPTGTFNDAAAADGKTVTLTGGTLAGGGKDNYTLSITGTLTAMANITAKQLTVPSITAASRPYDGTDTAAITGVTLSGIVAGEESGVSVSSPMGTFDNANAGDGKTVTLTGGTLAGTAKDNYTLSLTGTLTTTANITPKQLTVSSITAADKTYDGNTSATITASTLIGIVGSDDVSLNAMATFADKNAAGGKTVSLTSDSSLAGGKKDNYSLSLTGATTDTAAITARLITVTADAKSKYSGATDPALTYRITSGSLAGTDEITGALTRGPGEGIGSYPIQQGTLTAGPNYEITYVGAAFTINAVPYSGGGTATAPAPAVGSGGKITAAPPTLNRNTGVAATQVTSSDLSAALSKAAADSTGKKTVEITVPPVQSATGYETSLPASALSSSAGTRLAINTAVASVTLHGNMLKDQGLTGTAGITIGTADADARENLPDDVKAAVGDRPIIQLTLSVNGTPVSWNNSDAPVTVSIPYTPTPEELTNPEGIVVWYIDGSGNAVSVPNGRFDPSTGKVTVSVTHFSDYAVAYNPLHFSDVAEDAWYAPAVSFIAAREIATGTGNGNFSPDAKLTRGQFIFMLMKAYGIAPDTNPSDNFSDAGSTYYTGYLAVAKRLGVSAGVGSNMFAPGKEITRQEMFTLLSNALKVIGKLPYGDSGKTLSDFSDASQIDFWAKDAMSLMVETGTVGGSNGALTPLSTTTRAEMAQVLFNLLQK